MGVIGTLGFLKCSITTFILRKLLFKKSIRFSRIDDCYSFYYVQLLILIKSDLFTTNSSDVHCLSIFPQENWKLIEKEKFLLKTFINNGIKQWTVFPIKKYAFQDLHKK